MSRSRFRRIPLVVAAALVGVVLVAQFVPVRAVGENPPVLAEPAWDGASTRELATAACFDCHSNETRWPWYSRVAPVSWVVADHVVEGREALNFSQWGSGEQETEEIAEVIRDGSMAPWYYRTIHPEARLDAAQREALIEGLRATVGGFGEAEEERSDEDDAETDDR